MTTESGAQKKLPKLRKDITFTFGEYNIEGNPQWIIHDSSRNKFFMIGWIEHELLKRWNLRNPELIIQAVNNETTLHVGIQDLESLVRFLTNNYLIQQSGYQISKLGKIQHLFKTDNMLRWLMYTYLFFRIPLVHPDKFLTRTKRIGDLLFNRFTIMLMLLLAIIALNQISLRWDEFTHTFKSIFTWQGLFFYFIGFMVCKLFHELGHAYMCKQYDIPVPSLGIAFMVFWPVFYTDTTLSWSLKSSQRIRIALAGLWVETYITIIAALIWCNTYYLTLKSICYLIITVNWMLSLLINASPFMRFDGYYVLSDFLKMPNLQGRAFALTLWQIRRWLFEWPDPPPEKFSPRLHHLLVVYSLMTWIYRLVVYFGIALLVYHFFIKIVGIILFFVEFIFFILRPIYSEIKQWIILRDRFSWNLRTFLTLSIFFLFLVTFFLPFNDTIRLPATISHVHAFLSAPEEGILDAQIPAVGTHIKANQPIAKIVSPDINYQIEQIQLEYNKTLNEWRRAAVDSKYSSQKNILQSDMLKNQAELQKLLELRKKLTLAVPFDSVVIEVASELQPGNYVMKNEWIGDVIDPTKLKIEAYVSQYDVNTLTSNSRGKFYPEDMSEPIVPVKIAAIEAMNVTQINCRYSTEIKQDKDQSIVVGTPCYHASDYGGKIATLIEEGGHFIPVESVYRVLLDTNKPVKLHYVERGTIILTTQSRSYASSVFYHLRKVLLEQSSF